MKKENVIILISLLLGIVFLGFMFTGNMMGWGFCFACNDEHNDSGMMGMMKGHDDEHGDDEVKDYEIYPGKVADKIKNGKDIILLDVRTPEEYEEIHLKNSLLLPVGELSANTLADIGLGESAKDKEIIIYCRSGARSKQAYDIMNSLGYTNIKSVAGGMVHWQEDNYPFTEAGEYQGVKETHMEVSSNPQIVIDNSSYDFGEIAKSGGVVKTTFDVRNSGVENLEIGELSTSCGCTSAEISKTSIKPNEVAVLTVYFDPNFHDEPLDKITRTVFIPTNDPNMPEAEVKIMVDILEDK